MTKSKKKGNASSRALAVQPTKKDQVLDLLRRAGGASLAEMTNVTGWLPHTTRAMLTGFRKQGFTLTKEKVEGVSRYSISAEPGAEKAYRVTNEVRALAAADLAGLRDAWRRHGYGEPPKMRSTELLARLLAWRIQADAFGGLDAKTIRLLTSESLPVSRTQLAPGTTLDRDWQGHRYEVDVLENGFSYAGATYRSLSEVARAITGTRWNGWRFFGLRQPTK